MTEPDAPAPVCELPRRLAVDRIGPRGHEVGIVASPAECAAIAVRLALARVGALECRFRLLALPGGRIAAEGELRAAVTQTCVVSLEPFEATLGERFRVRFVPAGHETNDPDPESDDEIPYRGAVIELGEALVEQLALSLDPYPRAPGAALAEAAGDAAASPFAGLAGRRGEGH